MGHRIPMALGALVITSCSFIDDFDFEVAADGAAPMDDAGMRDGGEPPDGFAVDGPTADGGEPEECTDPCLGDAADDFGTIQGAGALGWRYLSDIRQSTGLRYDELAMLEHLGAPAWTDTTPPPAIVGCGESLERLCAMAEGELVFEANQPGDGGDPVLTFRAPMDGTYAVVVDVLATEGLATVTLSRQSRLDSVAILEANGPGTVTGTLDLFEGERGLVTVAPAATPGGAVSIAASIRVSRAVGRPALADCELALRFEESDAFSVECVGGTLTEDPGGTATTATFGPSTVHGGARAFVEESKALRASGARMDYSGDFTVQLWTRVDTLELLGTAVYSDLSSAVPADAGGVALQVDPRNADGSLTDIATAVFLFPVPAVLPTDPSIVCNASRCRGEIVGSIPSFSAWHFYRIVRRADLGEVRFCIDGELVGTAPLDGAIDISAPTDSKVGSYGNPTSSVFEGAVDDVRVFSRALPCGD